MNARRLAIEYLPTATLKPYAQNARTHSQRQVEQIAASLREFGWTNPVLVDASGGIVAGHGRVLAAVQLGMAEVPCVHVAGLTPDQLRAYVIADNQLALNAGWDRDILQSEVALLKLAGFELDVLGFDAVALEDLLAPPDAAGGLTDEDAAPPAGADAISERGDVWLLGKHRLMCGDSTDASDVSTLMAGKKAALMQTDPPYGIAYVANAKSKGQSIGHDDIENDDLDGAKLQAFLEAAIRAALPHLSKRAAFYLWHPMLTQGTFFAAAAAADILIHRQIIWQKPSMVFGRGDYHWQHELCFYGWVKGNRPPFYGQRNQTTLWPIGRETSKDHPTAKPVDLWKPPIENHTKPGQVMYEPFSGSGSQIIAAQVTGRACCAMELSGVYVDVAVKRWQAFTGQQAVHADGDCFDERAAAALVA